MIINLDNVDKKTGVFYLDFIEENEQQTHETED